MVADRPQAISVLNYPVADSEMMQFEPWQNRQSALVCGDSSSAQQKGLIDGVSEALTDLRLGPTSYFMKKSVGPRKV